MYKVTNKAKDVRKFRDGFLGRDVHVEPRKSVLTNRPPEESEIWKVEKSEQKPKAEKPKVEEKKKDINEEDEI